MKRIINKMINNRFVNRLLIKLKLDSAFQRANNYWTLYSAGEDKTHQEIAGYSHSKDVQEAVDKTHEKLKLITKNYIGVDAAVLDIGCGPGLYLKDFNQDKSLFGIDLNEKMLELAKTNAPTSKLVKGEFISYQFGSKFNLIYNIGMLQYIPMSKIEIFIKKISDLLEPDGILFISYPHAISEEDLKVPDLNYINYSPKYLNNVISKYFSIIENKHIIDDREILDFDKNPYKPQNVKFDKTYRNSSILVAKKR